MPEPQNPPGRDGAGREAPEGAATWAKLALRDQILAGRRRLSLAEIGEAARVLAELVVRAPEVSRAATVAAYASVGSEPGTGPLLDALSQAGKRVILPCLQPDLDLDWAVYDGTLLSAGRGLLEPPGNRLGADAIATADVVLVPGLAVDRRGFRLGRGGGSYDRALARVPVGTFTCVLLYDDEVGLDVPLEPHDRPVGAAASPTGITRLR